MGCSIDPFCSHWINSCGIHNMCIHQVLEYTNCQVFRKGANDNASHWINFMLFCSYIFCNKTFSKCLWSSKNCNMALLFSHFVFNTCEANPYCSYIYAEKGVISTKVHSSTLPSCFYFTALHHTIITNDHFADNSATEN